MANRIYIAIGLIAILFLGAAFVVPLFIDWNAYKGRMEQMTAEALGIEVEISGDMDFVLLPQPRMRIENVRIGPQTHPLGEAALVEADLSLMDFLRDRFRVTELRLIDPEINLTIDADGHLETPITLAQTATASNVSIQDARFENATVRVNDTRGGETFSGSGFSGEMTMSALRGPFAVSAQGSVGGTPYTVRFSTSAMNADGHMQISAFVRPQSGAFSTAVDGLLRTGSSPTFDGTLTYRQAVADTEGTLVGTMVLASPLTADTDALLLSGFTLLPDEDQPATRLTGQASLALGAEPSFNAVVSGGVVTLLPRSATEDTEGQPFELVRLLRELPEPLIPPLPGRIGMDINELVVRGTSLRDVRLDAVTDADVWTVEELSGRLAGDTSVKLTGSLGRGAGWPAFSGTLAMASARLDALALMWRRPEGTNPLFNMSGSLNGQIQLGNESLRFSDALFVLGDTNHTVSAQVRFGAAPRLELHASLSPLSSAQSAALGALLPPLGANSAFAASFPEGGLDLEAAAGTALGQRFSDFAANASWQAGGITLDQVSVAEFGGAAFEGALQFGGTLAEPQISGSGQLDIRSGASSIDLLFPGQSPHPLRRVLAESLPANLDVALEVPRSDGSQTLALEGRAGVADIWTTLEMGNGIGRIGEGRLEATMEAFADNGADLLDQLGLAPIIAGEDGALLSLSAMGNPRGEMQTELTLEGGGERFDFTGSLFVSDLAQISGQGLTSFLFEDTAELMSLAGAGGVWFPAIEGQAEIAFSGRDSLTLDQISAFVGDREVTGNLGYARQSQSALMSGALDFSALDLDLLAAMLAGPASVIRTDPNLLPDGPLDIGLSPRQGRGRITIDSPQMVIDDERSIEAVTFDYSWDNEEIRIRSFFGEIGGGTVNVEAALCCAANLPGKSMTGRFTLNGVRMDALLPQAPADTLDGRLTLGGQFQGGGDSFRSLAGALNGDGSFTIEDLRIENLSPGVFRAVAAIEDIIAIEADDLETFVRTALDADAFEANEAGGLFALVGGVARTSNIAIEGGEARLLGGGTLALGSLALNANWTLALTRALGGNDLITETTGRIGVGVGGTLVAPERSLDLSPMVDSIQLRAYEIELDELERLRAEQEARQRAQAEEQARLMEEESRRRAEELLREQQVEAERLQAEERQRALDALLRELEEEPEAGVPGTEEVPPPPQFVLPPNSSIFTLPPTARPLDGL